MAGGRVCAHQLSAPGGLMTTPPSDLRKVHMLLTYILSEFDRVCGQIGVDYALYGGSAIGAVRHGGFIPRTHK